MKDCRSYVIDKARKAAQQAFVKYTHNIYDRCHLYYDTGILEAVHDSEQTDLKLAINESLPRNLTIEQLTYWIISRVNRVPFLPEHL